MIGSLRTYAAKLDLKHILIVSSAVKERAIKQRIPRHLSPHGRSDYDSEEATVPATRLQELYEKLPAMFGFKKIGIEEMKQFSTLLAKRVEKLSGGDSYLWHAQTSTIKTANTLVLARRLRLISMR